MDNKGKKRVAHGATLYSKKTDKRTKSREEIDAIARSKKRIAEIKKGGINLDKTKELKDKKFLQKVIEFLGKSGVKVSSYKERYILRRVKVRIGRLRLDSYKDYYSYLIQHPAEVKELQESLSINVTRFFRNRDTFEMIRDEILPEILLKAQKHNRLAVSMWSAGCAVGCEPYTLGMVVSDTILPQIRVKILATDIKNELLGIAREGRYNTQYLAEMNDSEVRKYFHSYSENEYGVHQNIKRLISFNRHDLMKDPYPNNLDLIICRNVLIYVDRDAQISIIQKFFEALRPGGILILGRTETLFGDWRQIVDIVSTKHRIYRKKLYAGAISTYKPRKSTVKLKPKKKLQSINSQSQTLQSISDINDRLTELKNFRKVFEERKRIWEKRTEQKTNKEISNSSLNPNKPTRTKHVSHLKSRLRPQNRSMKSQLRTTSKPSNKEITPSYNSSSSLRRTYKSSRLSTIRKDKFGIKDLEIKYTETPEEIYKKILAKKKLRDAKRKSH